MHATFVISFIHITTVKWKPYFLRPDTPKEGIPLSTLKQQYPHFEQMQQVLHERGQEAGINFNSNRRIVNTMDTHRLTYLAGKHNKQQQLMSVLFSEYFEKANDISDHDVSHTSAPLTPPHHSHLRTTHTSAPLTPPHHSHLRTTHTSAPLTPPHHSHLRTTHTSAPLTPPHHSHLRTTHTSAPLTPPHHSHLRTTHVFTKVLATIGSSVLGIEKSEIKAYLDSDEDRSAVAKEVSGMTSQTNRNKQTETNKQKQTNRNKQTETNK